MKHILFPSLFIISIHLAALAQEQVIPDPYLKVIHDGGVVTISDPGDGGSFSFPGDSVYRLKNFELIVVMDDGKMGIIDPWDFVWMVKPVYTFVGPFNEETVLVRENGKYSVVAPYEDGFDHPFFKADTLYPFTPPDEPVYNDMKIYLLENKGKYGLYNTWPYTSELLPIKYDEIILLASHDEGIVYKMRKGGKWGAGDCEAYETKIAYDDIWWLTGGCSDNYFRVKKEDKYGLVATWSYGDYVYPPDFDLVSFAGDQAGNGYFILKKEGKWDVVDDSFPPFKPLYDNVHIVETEGFVQISMEKDGEITTLEIRDP